MVPEVKTEAWPGIFDPGDDELWMGQSDCDWVKAGAIKRMGEENQAKALSMRFPWIPVDADTARTMIQNNREAVLSIIGALMSWRNCTVSQLQAGLSRYPVPDFDRFTPNLYGAMTRMGILNVGFSHREYYERVFIPEIWLGLTGSKALVYKVTRMAAGYGFPLGAILRSGPGNHQYARHNTYVSHAGLAFAHDPQIKYTAGDGWALFRSIDPQAVGEMNSHFNNVPDLIAFTDTGLTAAVEVQSAVIDVKKKLQAWVDFLAHSPMSRRGLVCVWLLIPTAHMGMANLQPIFESATDMTGITVGEPPVSARIGWAEWSDWFDETGTPTERFGTFTDLLGQQRNIHSNEWGPLPDTADFSTLTDWGWNLMNRRILTEFGWDTSTWRKPALYRGDSYGFIGKETSNERQ